MALCWQYSRNNVGDSAFRRKWVI